MLQQDKTLRVMHLIRDPRGVLTSRWKAQFNFANIPVSDTLRYVKITCARMSDDVKTCRLLEMKYPKRIIGIRYEDLVSDHAHVAREVYDTLLGVPVPKEVFDGLDASINADKSHSAYGTMRRNSTETAFHWKTIMDPWLQEQVTNLCRSFLIDMRYEI